MLASMSKPTRICTEPWVNPFWWLERDTFQREEGYEVSEDRKHKVPNRGRRDHFRGQVLCYQCPFLAECRSESWGEPANIFAGLSYGERYRARVAGKVKNTVPRFVDTNDSSNRDVIEKRFLSGEDVPDIAASLDRAPVSVWYHIRRLLVQARIEQEEHLWNITPPPPFESPMTMQRFRLGAASSSGLATDLPE